MSYEERVKIEVYLSEGKKRAEISRLLNRPKSTVNREIKRNRGIVYQANDAEDIARYLNKKKHHRGNKIKKNSLLEYYIILRLRQRWSPEQIAKRLKRKYPKNKEMQVSHECIYTYIYTIAKGALKKELISYLKQQKSKRKKPCSRGANMTKIADRVDISERPPEVENRLIPGHWESDLIMGKDNKSMIGTIAERSTRAVLIVPLENKKASTVRKAFAEALQTLPEQMLQSMTHDNGTEMAEHKLFTRDTKIKVYFAHPYCSYERGTNENTNGLIRAFFPKGTDFRTVHSGKLREVQDLLNNRPRKCLDWRTPKEVFDEFILKKRE
jgi:IS30 family transposase